MRGLGLSLSTFFLALTSLPGIAAEPMRQPNIILIMTDDKY